MTLKRVIQTYKAPHQWKNNPPGLGDYVRGICNLVEMLEPSGMELRVDISQTEFANLITWDDSFFHAGSESNVANAEEYFVNHVALFNRLVAFKQSNETEIYICTNLGAWNRLTISDKMRNFAKKVYHFDETIEQLIKQSLPDSYEVLSLRFGDQYFKIPNASVRDDLKALICHIIEQQILPRIQFPLVITSDCHKLKFELAQRYQLLVLPHHSQHGAFGNALPVSMDMCMLKNSHFNYHINSWARWWSGFSHYTSMIFQIPSMNFRTPQFAKEEITADGQLLG